MSTPSPLPVPRVGAKTHPGKVRSENQDRMSRFATPMGEVFLVADGMGGHEGGGIAARMVSEGFEKRLGRLTAEFSPQSALQHTAQQVNAEIYRHAHDGDPRTEKMGSTAVLALVAGSRALIGHAGDSRAYLFRGGRLQRLTKDHSAIQKMLDHHMLTEAEARDHPDASVINRAFGQAPELELELSPPISLQSGDGLLLCTDGLCGYVDDGEIERVISGMDDAQQITDRLIDLALDAGGEDNVTIQFLQFGPRAALPPLREQSGSGKKRLHTGRTLEENAGATPSAEQESAQPPAADKWSLPWPWVILILLGAAALGVALGKSYRYLVGSSPAPTPTPALAPGAPAGNRERELEKPRQEGASSLPATSPEATPLVMPQQSPSASPYPVTPAPPLRVGPAPAARTTAPPVAASGQPGPSPATPGEAAPVSPNVQKPPNSGAAPPRQTPRPSPGPPSRQ